MTKIILIIYALLFTASASAQTFTELQKIPQDSINAEQMKIWIPVESPTCEVKIKILNIKNKIVKLLLEQKISKGYYNIYWDKKNDSDKYVSEGSYRVAVLSCNYKKIYPIEVAYQSGENSANIFTEKIQSTPVLEVDFIEDSVVTSLEIYNIREKLVDSVFTKKIYTKGKHNINWQPKENVRPGNYYYKLTLNNFSHWVPFKYKK